MTKAGEPCSATFTQSNDSKTLSLRDVNLDTDPIIHQHHAWKVFESIPDTRRYIRAPHGMRISEHHPLSEDLSTRSISPFKKPSSLHHPTITTSRYWNNILPPLASTPLSNFPETNLPRLPEIFARFPTHLSAADLSYLQLRDALTIPSEEIQIALLKAYIEFVHRNMPIIDLEEFMTILTQEHENWKERDIQLYQSPPEIGNQISFLLFQATMFAGTGFVSMTVIREMGYSSRESAQRAFFNRVRVSLHPLFISPIKNSKNRS